MQQAITKVINQIEADAYLPDWHGLTLRQILTDADRCPGSVVFWGCWNETELDTVFTG